MIRPRFALLVLLAVAPACSDSSGPHIDSVSPSSAGIGDTVTLHGSGFCNGAKCETVTTVVELSFDNPIMLGIDAISDTDIEVVVLGQGIGPGATELLVEVNGTASNTIDFTVE